MRNEPLGGKQLSPFELQTIISRNKGASYKKNLEHLRKLGVTSEKQDYTKIDPDIEQVFRNVFGRVRGPLSYEVINEQGQESRRTRRKTSLDFLKEDVNRMYNESKGRESVHRGRKRVKEDLILYLLQVCSAKYPEINIHNYITKEQIETANEVGLYFLKRSGAPVDILYPFKYLDAHIFDFAIYQDKHIFSLRADIQQGKIVMPFIKEGKEISECFILTLTNVFFDYQRRRFCNASKNMSLDWICLVSQIHCFRDFEKRKNVKLLKTNTQLCEIWGISLRTLNRRLAYLRQL